MHPFLISKVSRVSLLSKRNRESARKNEWAKSPPPLAWAKVRTRPRVPWVVRGSSARDSRANQSRQRCDTAWNCCTPSPVRLDIHHSLLFSFYRKKKKNPNKNKRKEEKSQCLADEKCRKEVIIEKFVQWNWPTNQPAVLYNNNENNNCNNGTEGARTVIN